jgi:hypothetical protein
MANKSSAQTLKSAQKYYDLDSYLFKCVTQLFVQRKTLSSFNFYTIITWKANRAVSKVRKVLKRKKLSPSKLMSQVSKCRDDREKMKTLDEVKGIGVPIASAILTVCYPERFTILDYRAWVTLCFFKKVKGKRVPTSIDGYFNTYLPACKQWAQDLKVSLRDLDHAMWGWSKMKSIERWYK